MKRDPCECSLVFPPGSQDGRKEQRIVALEIQACHLSLANERMGNNPQIETISVLLASAMSTKTSVHEFDFFAVASAAAKFVPKMRMRSRSS